MDFRSFLIYTVFLLVSSVLALMSQLCKKRINSIAFLIVTYIFIVTFWSLRYGIGFDYDSYIDISKEIRNGYDSYVEPVYHLASMLFQFNGGEFFTISLMSAITYFFLIASLYRNNILCQGIFFSIVLQYQFMASNQIRQALAIAVFLFALEYIEKKKYKIWIPILVLDVLLCHTSAFILFLIIPLAQNIKFSNHKWIIIIVVLYILQLAGVFRNLGNIVLTSLPIPENYMHFINSDRVLAEEIGFSPVFLFYIIITVYILIYYNPQNRINLNLYLIGLSMYIIFIEYHLLQRLSMYCFYVIIYIISKYCINSKQHGINVILASIVFYLFLITRDTNLHGVIPYKSLFDM
ncbi:EpsG family protein [uncultured Bacteroides sp.]|uniref:EpsG family protein n=1 Tax=uncultured Bacteroides sp. TaxID=162156 RepID=UPI0026074949|nr:EpsG family protein [uncultured Bacteroides sp.]